MRLEQTRSDAAIDDEVLAQPHLGTQAHGIFAVEVPQLDEIANFLSDGSAEPPMAIAIAVPSKPCRICRLQRRDVGL